MRKIVLVLLLGCSVLFSYAQVNLNLGLMAYYPFNGNANDISGNNNNPSFNNATLTSDRFGNAGSAYHFNGINSYMQIPNAATLNFTNKITLVAWVRVTGFYSGTCHGNRILMKGNTDGTPGNYLLNFDDNAYTNAQNCFITAPDVLHQNFYGLNSTLPTGGYTPYIQTNQWYSVIYTSDGVTGKLYVNCELKGSGPAGSSTFTNTSDLFFGKQNNPLYPYWFNGDLDEVRIYNRALTNDEINTLGGCSATSGCTSTFQKRYGGNKEDISFGIVANADGSFVSAAYTNSFGNGGFDGHLQKMDKNGNVVWSKAIGGAGNDYFYRVRPTPDGGYIAAGSTSSFGGTSSGSAWMVKTDANGTVQWARKFDDGNGFGSIAWDVITTADGGYALSGTNRFGAGTGNVMVLKTDNNGVLTWAKSFDSGSTDESFAVTEDADSLVVSAHQYGQSASFYDIVVMKLNKLNGNIVWAKNYDIDSKSNRSYEIYKTATGFSLSVSQDVGFSSILPDLVILNTNVNGNPVSLRKVAHTVSATPLGYLPTSDGGYITATVESNNPNADINLVKVNSTGTVQWTKKYGGAGTQASLTIKQTPDGGYVISGYNSSTPAVNDSADILIIKTDSLGNTPGCNTGTAIPTITTPPYTFNPGFVWNSVANLSFGATGISPSVVNVNPVTTTLCVSCQSLIDTIIINDYTPVTALDKCKNILTVGDDAVKYKAGDTVLLIQMKGAVIDSSNTAAFGSITDYKNAGNYEFNYIKSRNGNLIELKNELTKQYDLPGGKVQLIRVPFYQKLNTSSVLTCQQWNGTTGGVLVFNVADTLNLNADIDVNGKGFRGGYDPVSSPTAFNCYENQYYYPANPDLASEKGEGIASISAARSFGKGALANGGGGGNSHNSGGAGGSNSSRGGSGGYQYESSPCNLPSPPDNRGIAGNALIYSNTNNKIFLGGGGGAGHTNNPEGFTANGGNGAGIIIISADKIKTNGSKIMANGNAGNACGLTTSACHEGMGGGGAGGTVLLKINTYLDNTNIETKGGKGGDMTTAGFFRVGPGGGGSGGLVWLTNAAAPASVAISSLGGANGVCTGYANDPSGATAGQNGSSLFNLQLPIDNVLFKPTFDSSKLHIEVLTCTNFKFWGLNDAIVSQIVKWQWSLGDGYTDTLQTFEHNYVSPGTYPVKLIATDIYGCVATFKVDLTVLCRCEEIKLTSANPARDNITVGGLGCGINTLVLYNMLGQKITQVTGNNASETIRVSNLPKGMYIVRIINKDKIVKHIKVEKM